MTALPSGLLLFDTGIYIRFFRGEGYDWLGEDSQVFRRTVFTMVVAAELYSGTRSRQEKVAIDRLCRAHHTLGRLSVPTAETWADSGVTLRRARTRFGKWDFVHHFRDGLIAYEAIRAGATLITENVADFERWKALLGSARKSLKIFRPS